MSAPDTFAAQMPSANVCRGQPLHERAEGPVLLGPEHQVPMIRHKAVGQDAHRHALDGVDHDAFEQLEIRVVIEDPPPGVGPVERMKDNPTRSDTSSARHCDEAKAAWGGGQ